MTYIGTEPAASYTTTAKQTITGTGVATYTLDYDVASEQDIQVFLNNVRQEGGSGKAYTVSDNQITFADNISSTDDLYVLFTGKAIQTLVHPAGQDLQAREGTFSGDLTVDTDTLYVDSTNNRVGIGTTSPTTAALDVHGSLDVIKATGSTGNSFIRFTDSDASSDFSIGADDGSGAGSGAFIVYDRNNSAYRAVINSSGNVGIGLTNPAVRLHVKGGTNENVMIVDATGTSPNYIFDVRDDGTSKFRVTGSKTTIGDLSHGSGGNNTALDVRYSGGGFQYGANFLPEVDNAQAMGFFNASGTGIGSIYLSASGTTYYTTSDYRLKENDVDMTGAIARVKQLQPKRFNFIADADTTVDGFMAHEVQTVVPEAISGTHNEVDDEGNPVYQGIDQSKLVPLLTGALQEAIAKIEALEARVTALELG